MTDGAGSLDRPPVGTMLGIGIDHGSKPGAERVVLIAASGWGINSRVWVLDEWSGSNSRGGEVICFAGASACGGGAAPRTPDDRPPTSGIGLAPASARTAGGSTSEPRMPPVPIVPPADLGAPGLDMPALIAAVAAHFESADDTIDYLWDRALEAPDLWELEAHLGGTRTTWRPEHSDALAVLGIRGAHDIARAVTGCPVPVDPAAEYRARRGVQTFIEASAAEVQRRQQVREAACRAMAEATTDGERQAARRRLLQADPGAREELALAVDARRAGRYWRRAPCPICGRSSVYWHIDRGWARCQHANSCGWQSSLFNYAVLLGADRA